MKVLVVVLWLLLAFGCKCSNNVTETVKMGHLVDVVLVDPDWGGTSEVRASEGVFIVYGSPRGRRGSTVVWEKRERCDNLVVENRRYRLAGEPCGRDCGR